MTTKKKPASKSAIATQETALANFDYGDEVTGFEGQTQADRETPLLIVLQDGTPVCKPKNDAYIEGAESGMFFNTATQEVYSGEDGIVFVPACTKHVFLEFVPRDKGGGFVGMHDPDSGVVQRAKADSKKFGKYNTPGGNELNETFQVFAVLVEDGVSLGLCVIPFSSTKIKPYKKWNTRCLTTMLPGQRKPAPLFANLVRMTTYATKNSAGQDYNNVTLSPAVNDSKMESLLDPNSPLLAEARQFCLSVQDGDKVAAAPGDQTQSEDQGPADVENKTGDTKSPDAPF